MDKGNIRRLIVWSILLIIFVSLTVLGIVKFYQGYGKYGSIRKELLPIVEKFNSLDKIKNNTSHIKAKISNDKIVVTYNGDDANIDFSFEYNNIAGMQLLSLKYDVYYSTSAMIVVESMIDAVSIYNNNNEGEVFSKYKFSDFYATNTKQGVQLVNNGKYIKVDININENIINNLEDVVLNPLEVTFITTNDIIALMNELKKNNKFDYTKKNTGISVRKNNNTYFIYAGNSKDDNNTLYESIMSVVSLINSGVYDDISSSNNRFNSDITELNYSIETKPTIDKEDITLKYNNIVKVTIKN